MPEIINLTDKAIAVEVPKDADNFMVVTSDKGNYFDYEYPVDGNDSGTYGCADLPPGSYQFLSLHSKISESDAGRVVWCDIYESWMDYVKGKYDSDITCMESYATLTKSHNLDEGKEYAILIKI